MSFADIAGLVGVGAILSAYALLQSGRLAVRAPIYSALNLVGSALILVSLAVDFNLPSAIIEGAWAVVSLYGLVVALRRRGGTTTRRSSGTPVAGGEAGVEVATDA